jgi:hypothetical protein
MTTIRLMTPHGMANSRMSDGLVHFTTIPADRTRNGFAAYVNFASALGDGGEMPVFC